MSLKNWLGSLFASRSKQGAPRSQRRRSPWRKSCLAVEVLEDRVVPDSGGAAGVLTSAGNLQLNPNHQSIVGINQVIPNVKIQLIFLTDSNSGSTVPAATQTALTNFFSTITSDQYIPSLVSPYGGILGLPAIGTGSVGVVDVSASAAPDTTVLGHPAYSGSKLTSIIQAEINNHNTAASDGLNNLYFLFTPPTDAVLRTTGTDNSIQSFFGYHSSFFDNGKRDYYAIMPIRAASTSAILAAAPPTPCAARR